MSIKPATEISIKSIVSRNNQLIASGQLNPNRKLLDGSEILYRKYDIPSSHSSTPDKKPSYDAIKKSIGCDINLHSNKTYILLDDIYTRGITMKAHADTLKEHGAETKNIKKLVVGKTEYINYC